jgi:hypothetical protein
MSGNKKESPLEPMLREIGLRGRSRDATVMEKLAEAIIHPGQISESPYLADDDPLKIAARQVMEDFEAVTNGMDRPEDTDSQFALDTNHPFDSWRILTEAIAAFYAGNLTEMKKLARSIPRRTPAAGLQEIFEELSGKPPKLSEDGGFAESLLKRCNELSEGMEILDEASAYPELLRTELSRYLPRLSQESPEGAKRLYYWAMKLLAEDEPISESDELTSIVPGVGEASRICALASVRYDPDRALLAWLRSLRAVAVSGDVNSSEIAVRLNIAAELFESAQESQLLSEETLSGTAAALEGIFPIIKIFIPELPTIPDENNGLCSWMKYVQNIGLAASNLRPERKNVRKRRSSTAKSKELFLFDEPTI